MGNDSYLRWLTGSTPTLWWHDSGDPDELDRGLEQGACGVTTNPVLTSQALHAQPTYWRGHGALLPEGLHGSAKVEWLMHAVAIDAAAKVLPYYQASGGAVGYVCAQVNPNQAGDRDAMLDMARQFHLWAPNIAVKLPVTAAGLDVLEACIAEGITVTATVSFTVPQVIAIAERHRLGSARAREAGLVPGHCFAVIMIGRLDDYLRDIAWDRRAEVSEADIRSAGLAVTKRAYEIYEAKGYEAVLLVAALRGIYHATELAGGKLILSVHPKVQAMLQDPAVPRQGHIGVPVASDAVRRLQVLPEFVKAYEPNGMRPEEFMAFGLTQRTLAQFDSAGWAPLETFRLF